MMNQFNFLTYVLKGVENKQHLYAADILFQLYKCRSALAIEDILSFFRNQNPLFVWETIMTLKDLGFIQNSHAASQRYFCITETGVEKVHFILACFRVGRYEKFIPSSNPKHC